MHNFIFEQQKWSKSLEKVIFICVYQKYCVPLRLESKNQLKVIIYEAKFYSP